jgi:hypothetical protein
MNELDQILVKHVTCQTPVELRWIPSTNGKPDEETHITVAWCPKCERTVLVAELSSPGPYSAAWV